MQIPEQIAAVLKRLESAGYEAYLVGGCVRDALRGEEPHDFDITTKARPDQTMALFADFPVIETGLQHGTVAVIIDHQPIEITTYRIETTYSDHRHPDEVKFAASVEEDLSRRDFTINAMAMDQRGNLVDPFGGREDLERGLIRCVGEPRLRFSEDALRILRGMRFAARFGFALEAQTKAALFACAPLLKEIAAERILAELKGILVAPHAGEILSEFEPVLLPVMPRLSADPEILEKLPPKESLRFAGWLWRMGEGAKPLLRKLKASNALQKEVALLIEGQQIAYPRDPQRLQIRAELARFGEQSFFDHLLLQFHAGLIEGETYTISLHLAIGMLKEGICLAPAELAIGGKDLMELGLQGPKIGRMQQLLFRLVMEERLPNERGALLEFAKNHEK